jgi:hypothetical protein
MKTIVTTEQISNPLSHEIREPIVTEHKGYLSDNEVFEIKYPRLFELGHDSSYRGLPAPHAINRI